MTLITAVAGEGKLNTQIVQPQCRSCQSLLEKKKTFFVFVKNAKHPVFLFSPHDVSDVKTTINSLTAELMHLLLLLISLVWL